MVMLVNKNLMGDDLHQKGEKMKTIQMGLNTEPAFVNADEIIKRCEANGETAVIEYQKRAKERTLKLKAEIIEAVEADGECALNWGCTGATLFDCLAHQWANALKQYRFEIGRYTCKVFKN